MAGDAIAGCGKIGLKPAHALNLDSEVGRVAAE
jgi:hypothetical protein